MTQNFLYRDLVYPQTLISLCTNLIGTLTTHIPELLEQYVQEDPLVSIYGIEKYSKAIDIPQGCFKWIIHIKDTFIECTFSNTDPGKNRCIDVSLKQIDKEPFREIYKWVSKNSHPIHKEGYIRRQQIDKYNLALYETWKYQEIYQLKIVERPQFRLSSEDKYIICFQPIVRPGLIMNLSKSLLHITTQEAHLLLEEHQDQYPEFWIEKIEEYPSGINDSTHNAVTWKISLVGDVNLICNFEKRYPDHHQPEPPLTCVGVHLDIKNQSKFDEFYTHIKENGILDEEEEKSTIRKIVEEFNYPRYENWLYDDFYELFVVEQPADTQYKYNISIHQS